MASPDLAARIGQMISPRPASTRDLRRAVVSLASYLRRWQRRVTPFGLFAGVSSAAPGLPLLCSDPGTGQLLALRRGGSLAW